MQFLTLYHVIISNVHVSSFACAISHVHGCASKTVLRARNLEKLSFMKACIDMLNVVLKVFKVCDKGTRATPIQKDVWLFCSNKFRIVCDENVQVKVISNLKSSVEVKVK